MSLQLLETTTAIFAMAPPGGGGGSGQPGIGSFILPLGLTIVIMYFLIFRPQQKRMSDHKKFTEGLKKGDHVLTNSGIYGRIWAIEDKVVTLEVAKNVRIQVTRESVSSRQRADEADEKEKDKGKENA